MPLPIRRPAPEELPALARAMGLAFGGDPTPEEEPHLRALVDLERARCAMDGDEIVGTIGSYSFELAVPGATLPAAGTTLVSVRTTHRRRGVMTSLVREHLDEVAERGEPLAALWASESSIYGRFGYGAAVESCRIAIATARSGFRDPVPDAGRCRIATTEEAHVQVPRIYESLWRERAGHFARSATWWEHRHFWEPESEREGATLSRWLLYEDASGISGYARYNVKPNWSDSGLPDSRSELLALYAPTPEGRATLWRTVLDQDLVSKLVAWEQPVDCELLWLLADPRRARRRLRESLWVRIMDVPAALEARRYRRPAELVFELRDDFRDSRGGGSSRWHLDAAPTGAKCTPTSRTPELRLGVEELGEVYLGSPRIGPLARAGRIEGDPDAIARAHDLFGWDPAPWCPEVF